MNRAKIWAFHCQTPPVILCLMYFLYPHSFLPLFSFLSCSASSKDSSQSKIIRFTLGQKKISRLDFLCVLQNAWCQPNLLFPLLWLFPFAPFPISRWYFEKRLCSFWERKYVCVWEREREWERETESKIKVCIMILHFTNLGFDLWVIHIQYD